MKIERYNKEQITEELLSSLKVGDIVAFANEAGSMNMSPMKIKGVSKNFIILNDLHNREKDDENFYYSIICKHKAGYTHNSVTPEDFIVGPDNTLFGHTYGYKFDNQKDIEGYLSCLEHTNSSDDIAIEMSQRNSIPLTALNIVRGKTE